MNSFSVRSISVLLALLPAATLRAADLPAGPELGRNAALIYWQAFDQLAAKMKDEGFAKAVSESSTIAIDDKVRGYIKEANATLTLMRFAAAIDACDWGTDLVIHDQGPYTLLPHLSKLRELTRLALLSARVKLADKQGGAAMDDLFAVYQMARHSQAGDVMINHLVGIANEASANQFIADHHTAFSVEELRVLHDRYMKLKPLSHVKNAIAAEGRTFGGWMKREAAKLADPKARRQFLALIGGEEQKAVANAIKDKKLEEMVKEMFSMYETIAKLMELPPAEFRKEHETFQKKIEESKNPLSRMLLPAFATTHGTYHRSLAHREMVRALLVWRLEGKAAFEAIEDPYGDGPFAVETKGDTVEIKSKLTVRNEPVMLKAKWESK